MNALVSIAFETRVTELQELYADHVKVSANRIEINQLNATDIAALLNIVLGDSYLPEEFPSIPSFQIRSLVVTRDSFGFIEGSIDIALSNFSWTPSDNLTLHLDSLQALLSETGLVMAHGSALIDGLELKVSIELPTMVLHAELHPGDSTNPSGNAAQHERFLAARKFLPVEGSRHGNTTPKLLAVAFDSALALEQASFRIAVADLIDAKPFRLDLLEVELEYSAGLAGSAQGHVYGLAEITLEATSAAQAAQVIEIELAADANPEGWHFLGSVKLPTSVTLATLVDALGDDATNIGLPNEVSACHIEYLTVEFSSANGDLAVACVLDWPHSNAVLQVNLKRSSGNFVASGHFSVDGLSFDLAFAHSTSFGNTLLGAVSVADEHPLDIPSLLVALGADVTLLPKNLPKFSMQKALVAMRPDGKRLITADVKAGFDLSGLSSLPLLGSLVPRDLSIRVGLQPLGATGTPWLDTDVSATAALRPINSSSLPDKIQSSLQLTATLNLGASSEPTVLPLDVDPSANPTPVTTVAGNQAPAAAVIRDTPAANAVTWVDVGRHLGPLHLSRVGFAADKARQHVDLLIAANLELGGLTLSVDGLGVGYTLPTGEVDVAIKGFGIDYSAGPVEMAGAFLNLDGDFAGKVIIKTPAFGVTATGAIAMLDGTPSVFLYGVLDYPLGGPPFFFVDGLAAGFGVHRSLTLPSLTGIKQFPFVQDATAGSGAVHRSLSEELRRLHDFISPQLGEYFFAVGVKFTSFKLIESFVLLIAKFGEHFELDLLGTASYQTPPNLVAGVPALARVELELLGRFAPDEGVVSVQARLTDQSYVYSPVCHVFGGFAFCTWFSGEHAGDFVLSVGGYHPEFNVPPHYPAVDRIGMKFQVTEDIYLKGSAYFALTPSVFMAGGAIDGVAEIGSLRAWFHLGVDFLIGWQPYHYDARLSVDVGAKWKCFHTTAHAELHIWGPEFAGMAEVDWAVFSFEIDFGDSKPSVLPINWNEFETSFLPSPQTVCSTHVIAGLVRTLKDANKNDHHVVNRSEMVISVNTVVPASSINCNGNSVNQDINGRSADDFGLGPTNIAKVDESKINLVIERLDANQVYQSIATEMKAVPVLNKFPTAIWGTDFRSSMHADMITAIGSVQLHPATAVERSTPLEFRRDSIDYNVKALDIRSLPRSGSQWTDQTDSLDKLVATPSDSPSANRRDRILTAFGIQAGQAYVSDAVEKQWRARPQSMHLTRPTAGVPTS